MEVFVEEEQIAEASVGLSLRRPTVKGPASVRSARKDADQALRKIARNFPQRRHMPRAGWKFDSEIVAVIEVEVLQRFDDQEIDREPDRTSPIRVAAEESDAAFGRVVVDAQAELTDLGDVGVLFVVF